MRTAEEQLYQVLPDPPVHLRQRRARVIIDFQLDVNYVQLERVTSDKIFTPPEQLPPEIASLHAKHTVTTPGPFTDYLSDSVTTSGL